METRIDKLELVVETTSDHLAAVARDLAVIRSNCTTKADLIALECTLIKWFTVTAIAIATIAFTAAKFVN